MSFEQIRKDYGGWNTLCTTILFHVHFRSLSTAQLMLASKAMTQAIEVGRFPALHLLQLMNRPLVPVCSPSMQPIVQFLDSPCKAAPLSHRSWGLTQA
jgi:hypothetical protein